MQWGRRLIWGDRFIDGRTAYVRMAGWDDNIVWGNSDDDNIVWGSSEDDNIVWGNNIVWGFTSLQVLTGVVR